MTQAIEILQNYMDTLDPARQHTETIYEIWSPQITPETARQLLDMLDEDATTHG